MFLIFLHDRSLIYCDFEGLIFTNVYKKKLKITPLAPTRAVQTPCLKLAPALTSNSGSAPGLIDGFENHIGHFCMRQVCVTNFTHSAPIICTHVGGPLSYIINVFYNSSTYFDCLFSLHSAGAG